MTGVLEVIDNIKNDEARFQAVKWFRKHLTDHYHDLYEAKYTELLAKKSVSFIPCIATPQSVCPDRLVQS